MGRTLYLTAYDVCNPRRLVRVRRFLVGYKVAGQKSFFECWLTAGELTKVLTKLRELTVAGMDRVHVLQLDPRMRVRCFGVAETFRSPTFMVV